MSAVLKEATQPAAHSDVVLQTRGLSMAFGGLRVFNDLEFSMARLAEHYAELYERVLVPVR